MTKCIPVLSEFRYLVKHMKFFQCCKEIDQSLFYLHCNSKKSSVSWGTSIAFTPMVGHLIAYDLLLLRSKLAYLHTNCFFFFFFSPDANFEIHVQRNMYKENKEILVLERSWRKVFHSKCLLWFFIYSARHMPAFWRAISWGLPLTLARALSVLTLRQR